MMRKRPSDLRKRGSACNQDPLNLLLINPVLLELLCKNPSLLKFPQSYMKSFADRNTVLRDPERDRGVAATNELMILFV